MGEEIIPRCEIKHKPGSLFYRVLYFGKRDKTSPSFFTNYAMVPTKAWAHYLARKWLERTPRLDPVDEVEVILPKEK